MIMYMSHVHDDVINLRYYCTGMAIVIPPPIQLHGITVSHGVYYYVCVHTIQYKIQQQDPK